MTSVRTRRLSAALAVALAGGFLASTASAETVEDSTEFFLRMEGCGATAEPGRLSTESGTDSADGCGVIGGLPVNELFHQAGVDFPDSYTTENGVPLTVDAAQDADGVIAVQSWTGLVGGVGEVVVDVTLDGIDKATNKFVILGSASATVLATPGLNTQVDVPFSIDIPDTAQAKELKSLTLTVNTRGANLNASAYKFEGASKITIPTLTTVEEPVEETAAP